MENIVAQSLEKLYTEFEKVDQLFLDSGMKDMDAHERLSCAAETAVLVEAARSNYSRDVYSDRMSSRPMGWSEAGADAMCRLRCYVRDYGEEKVIELVKYRRKHKQLEATGTEAVKEVFERGYMKKLLYGHHDSDRVYLERMQATITSIKIRKNWQSGRGYIIFDNS